MFAAQEKAVKLNHSLVIVATAGAGAAAPPLMCFREWFFYFKFDLHLNSSMDKNSALV